MDSRRWFIKPVNSIERYIYGSWTYIFAFGLSLLAFSNPAFPISLASFLPTMLTLNTPMLLSLRCQFRLKPPLCQSATFVLQPRHFQACNAIRGVHPADLDCSFFFFEVLCEATASFELNCILCFVVDSLSLSYLRF